MRGLRTPRVVAAAAAFVAAVAGLARAEGAAWKSIQVKDRGDGRDVVTVSGTIADPKTLPTGVSVTVRLGAHEQTIPAAALVWRRQTVSWKARPGASGVQSFTLSRTKGTFALVAKSVETGDLGGDVPFSIDIGGRSIATLHALTENRGKLTWKQGEPVRARLSVQVLEVTHSLGNVLLRPATGRSFGGGAGSATVTVAAADRKVPASGRLTATIEVTDQAALREIDMSAVFGAPPGFTEPGFSRVTAGDDGEALGLVFVERRRGADATIPPGGAVIDAPGSDGAPSGTLSVPAGAVSSVLGGVRLTPLAIGTLLPAPLPQGWSFVAGAEITADRPETFAAESAPTLTLSRPAWAERDPLAGAELRLLWWDGAAWAEQAGAASYDEGTDRIGPAAATPAKVPATGFVAYAARTSVSGAKVVPKTRSVRGRVLDTDGVALGSQVVLTRAGAVVTGADGTFDVAGSALSDDSLEVVQAIGSGVSASRAVTRAEAERGEVEVIAARRESPTFVLAQVSGTVHESGGTIPSPGASVSVALASASRGMEIDDGGTPADLFDDVLSVPDLSDLGVRTFAWRLTQPGERDEMLSSVTGRSVNPLQLVLEAQAAGRGVVEGAHTVRVSYTVPVLGEVNLYAGFRLSFEDITPRITDVQLPAAVEVTSAVTGVADAQGRFQLPVYAPLGVPMRATAVRADEAKTDAQSFYLALQTTQDLVFPVDADPPAPAGVPLDQWVSRAPMGTPRKRAASAVLDGRVWVAGGTDGGGTILASCESFDPHANAWTARAAMSTARDHAGMAAVGGEIWVFGGYDGTNLLATVEAYDPATNTWSARPSMPVAREDVQVAVLGGRVYVCGGSTVRLGVTNADRVDIFDLASGEWLQGPVMPFWCVGGTAFVSDDKVYVTGDVGFTPPTAEFDPASGLWRQLTRGGQAYSRPSAAFANGLIVRLSVFPRITHIADDVEQDRIPTPVRNSVWGMAEAIDGVVYHFGGTPDSTFDLDGAPTAAVDALRLAWKERTPMPTSRGFLAAAVVGNVVYAAGGTDLTSSLRTLEAFDTVRDVWRTRTPMGTARESFALVESGGLLYAIGGVSNPGGTALASVEAYDPATDTWTPRAPMAIPRAGAAAGAIGGKIYVAGGSGKSSAEVYDPATNTWRAVKPMSTARTHCGASVANGRLYVFGGSDGTVSIGTGEVYDPVSNTWTPRAGTGGFQGIEQISIATIGGKLVRTSGFDSGSEYYHGRDYPFVGVYDILANVWRPGPTCPFPARGAAIVTVGDRVFWIGGVAADLSTGVDRTYRGVRTYRPE